MLNTEPKNNRVRRERYAQDESYADTARAAARDYYKRNNPKKPTKLARGLLTEGTAREVICGDIEHPISAVTFTLPESADALGRARSTFSRWLKNGLIPTPVLRDATTGYRLYSSGELHILAAFLAEHEDEFTYYTDRNTEIKEQVFQSIQGYRTTNI